MNNDQSDAIENLMSQGFSRIQAIKIFYEQSLAKYYTKQNRTEIDFEVNGRILFPFAFHIPF